MPLSTKAALAKDTAFRRQYKGPTMQHRHFSIVAAIIKAMPTHAASLRTQQDSCARAFAAGLGHTNPNFDRARFLRACGIED